MVRDILKHDFALQTKRKSPEATRDVPTSDNYGTPSSGNEI